MATIKDIAKAAGVSIGTVDRIIHNRGRFSEETARRVRELMNEMEYSPNIHARGLKKTRKYSFTAVIPEVWQDAGYWSIVAEGIKRASSELSTICDDIQLFHFDRYSAESCIDVLSKVFLLKTDGLLIAPVFPENVVEILSEADVPYIFIDTDVPDISRKISFIGQDSFQSGVLSGKLMSLMIGRNKNSGNRMIIVEPPGSDFHLKSRIDGFTVYLNENVPELDIYHLKISSDKEPEYHNALKTCLSGISGLPAGIFAANSSVYHVASYLKQTGEPYRSVPVIGYDLIPGRESLIEDETINFILTQQPEQQAYRGIMMLYDSIVLNKTVNKNVIVPLNIITRENLHTFGENFG